MKCPTFEDLLDYCDGHTNKPDAQFVAGHLASGCQQCVQDAGWYKRVRGIAASEDFNDPPAWVFKRALRLFENRPQASTVHFGRLLAALAFDSFARPVLSGVRLVETSNRQLLYRAGAYTIDLQLDFSPPTAVNLIGQILRESESRFESVSELLVRITREGRPVDQTTTSATGEFTIQHLAHNEYDLSVETKEGVIDVPRLPVKPADA
jgi:hypothetical protein